LWISKKEIASSRTGSVKLTSAAREQQFRFISSVSAQWGRKSRWGHARNTGRTGACTSSSALLCKPHSFGFFIRWGWRVATAPASKQAASLFIRTGHGQGDKADHDVPRPSPFVCLVGSQPEPALRSSLVRHTEDNRAWRRRIAWDGLTDPIDGAGPPSLPGRRAAAGKGTCPCPCPCPPESMARSYGRLVWARLLSRGSSVLVDTRQRRADGMGTVIWHDAWTHPPSGTVLCMQHAARWSSPVQSQ
jgi:hypothetical protein